MLLVKRRISTEDTDEIGKIEEALKKVAAAKDASEKEKVAKGPSGDPELDSTRKLMEAGKYEEAIKQLDERKLATGGDSKSDALKSEAVTKLINQERNRAAKLFLAAKNTSSTSQKAKLLTDCLNILKALVEKYPTSPMIEKINSHIAKVEEELSTLQKDSP
jgi:hypothetical protein